MANVYNKKHKFFFLSLKTAYQKKQRFFTYFSKNPKLIIILKKLQEKSLIQGFYQTNVSQLQIFLRYDMNSLPAINNIFLFPKMQIYFFKNFESFSKWLFFIFFFIKH